MLRLIELLCFYKYLTIQYCQQKYPFKDLDIWKKNMLNAECQPYVGDNEEIYNDFKTGFLLPHTEKMPASL